MSKKYDILLIQPQINDKRMMFFPPLSLLYVAAPLVEKGINVKILDRNILKRSTVEECIKNINPKIVGFTTITGPMLRECLELSKFAKENSDAKILWGGTHATLMADEVINEDVIDIVVKGEGDYTLLDIWNNFNSLHNVRGILFKKNGEVIETENRKLIEDLDTLPFIHWDLVDIGKYITPWADAYRTLPIITGRGCSGNCKFCYNYTRRYRGYSTDRIIAEIERIHKYFNLDGIRFDLSDDFIGDSPERAVKIANYVGKNKLRWSCELRISQANEYLLKAFKEEGCRYILFGVESGSPKILNLIGKDQTPESIINIFEIANTLNIRTTASVMFDFPNEKEEDLDMTWNLINKLNCYVTLLAYQPYPGTALFSYLKNKMGWIPPNSTLGWSNFRYENVHGFCGIKNINSYSKSKLFYYTYIHNLKIGLKKKDKFMFKIMAPKVLKDLVG